MASVAGLLASSDQLGCTWNCILRVLGQEGQDIKLDKMEIIILVTFFWEITSNPFAKTPGFELATSKHQKHGKSHAQC